MCRFLFDLVAVVDDAKFDLLGVAGVDLDGAVVGIDADLGPAGDRCRTCSILRARAEQRRQRKRMLTGKPVGREGSTCRCGWRVSGLSRRFISRRTSVCGAMFEGAI